MVSIDIVKLRWIFDSVATDLEAVVTEKNQFEETIQRLQREKISTVIGHTDIVTNYQSQIRALRRELRKLRPKRTKRTKRAKKR